MSSVDKVSNFLGCRKYEVVTTPLLEKKPSIKEFDKGTDELKDMKKRQWSESTGRV